MRASEINAGDYVQFYQEAWPGAWLTGRVLQVWQSLGEPQYFLIELLEPFRAERDRWIRVSPDHVDIKLMPPPLFCAGDRQRELRVTLRAAKPSSHKLQRATRGDSSNWDAAAALKQLSILLKAIKRIRQLLPPETPGMYLKSWQRAEELATCLRETIFSSIIAPLPQNVDRRRSQFRCHLRKAVSQTDAGLTLGAVLTVIDLSKHVETSM